MSIESELQRWLDHRALADYIDKGYSLVHYQEGTLEIRYKDKSLAALPEVGTKPQDILRVCQRHEAALLTPVGVAQ